MVSVTRQLTDSCQLIVIMIMVLMKVLIPPRSTDLRPVEKFWSWLRRKLRAMDLKDAVAKRPVLGKMAYKGGCDLCVFSLGCRLLTLFSLGTDLTFHSALMEKQPSCAASSRMSSL